MNKTQLHAPTDCFTPSQLCLTEKMFILQADKKNLLNKRSKLVSKCRHINKFLLKNVRLKA